MRKYFYLGIVIVTMLSMLVTASPALAAKPVAFEAGGTITAISPGVVGENVFPAGNSGRWRVTDRTITGVLTRGDIAGDITIQYQANVDATQAGNFHGSIVVAGGSYSGKINGSISSVVYDPGLPLPPRIDITGHWNLNNGARGNGTFEATIFFLPLGEHVLFVIPEMSTFTMSGDWQP
ncbi:hypothetical protein ACFLW1_00370 [Chloroflexota bacterium]